MAVLSQPAALLREELQAAGAAGVEFETAWRFATGRALVGVRGEELADWVAAFVWAGVFWRNAYLRVGFDVCGRPIYPT